MGHDVTIFAIKCRKNGSFEDSKNLKVEEQGWWIWEDFFGYFTIFFSLLRVAVFSLCLCMRLDENEAIFVDTYSIPALIFRIWDTFFHKTKRKDFFHFLFYKDLFSNNQ